MYLCVSVRPSVHFSVMRELNKESPTPTQVPEFKGPEIQVEVLKVILEALKPTVK